MTIHDELYHPNTFPHFMKTSQSKIQVIIFKLQVHFLIDFDCQHRTSEKGSV